MKYFCALLEETIGEYSRHYQRFYCARTAESAMKSHINAAKTWYGAANRVRHMDDSETHTYFFNGAEVSVRCCGTVEEIPKSDYEVLRKYL